MSEASEIEIDTRIEMLRSKIEGKPPSEIVEIINVAFLGTTAADALYLSRLMSGILEPLISKGDILALTTILNAITGEARELDAYLRATAVCLAAEGRGAAAANIYRQLIERNPNSAQSYHRLAACMVTLQEGAHAENAYLKGLSLAPKSTHLRREFAGLLATRFCLEELTQIIDLQRKTLSACIIVKDEQDDILEWLHFHKCVGFEHFYIYYNESSDQTGTIISQFPWPEMITYHKIEGRQAQSRAYQHFLCSYKEKTEWAAFIDADEFLLPVEAFDIKEVLSRYVDSAAIVCNWLNFGSSGFLEKPPNLCVEAFQFRARDTFPDHHVVKSIIRPRLAANYHNPHHMHMYGPTTTPSGIAVQPFAGRIAVLDLGILRINHYNVKSKAQCEAKRGRGRFLAEGDPQRIRTTEYFEMRDTNELLDTTIQRFLPKLNESMGDLNRGMSSCGK